MNSVTNVFVICIVFLFTQVNGIKAVTFDECDGVEDESYVISAGSCASYIYCNGDDSESFECEEGQYFDVENGSCDDKENVFCPLDETDEDGGEEEEPEEPEETEEPIMSAPVTPITTTAEPITRPSTAMEIVDQPPLIMETCPSTDDPNRIVLVASSNSCSDYYVCYHGQALEMHCMDHLHFNSLTGKCDFPENSNCKITNQQPQTVHKCLPHINNFFPHPHNCNYFIYCIKGYETIQQCPFYYGWDIERRTCVHMKQAKCYVNTN